MKSWKRDFILSVCLLVFIVITLCYSYILESPRIKLFLARPDTYMALWLVLMGVLAVMLLVRSLKDRPKEEALSALWCKLGVFTTAVLIVYLLIISYVGFFLSSGLMLAVLIFVYSINIGVVKKDYKNFRGVTLPILIKSLVFSFLASFITTRIFTDVLSANLPTFRLFS